MQNIAQTKYYDMKILFLIYHGLSPHSGISKKIQSQVKGLEANGHQVALCTYSVDGDGHRIRYIDGTPICDYGTGKLAALKKRYSYECIVRWAKEQHIDFVYVRSFHNANPWTIRLFRSLRKCGIRIAMEIPTYPYDAEYAGFSRKERTELLVDKVFRKALARETDAIVTFSNDDIIFGQHTIRISNGVDFEQLPLHQPRTDKPGEVHLILVAEVHYWHGVDRLLTGLGEYYRTDASQTVHLHVVGGVGPSEWEKSIHAIGFREIIELYHLEPYAHFYGALYGEKLNALFNQADFAIGSLARHRCGISHIKTLKNREYAARGFCFAYSECDDDFDDKPYVLKFAADESPIDIAQILRFIQTNDYPKPAEIRADVAHLSWAHQMQKVVQNIEAL